MALEIVVFLALAVNFGGGIYCARNAKWLIKNNEYKLAGAFVFLSIFFIAAPVYFAITLWGPNA